MIGLFSAVKDNIPIGKKVKEIKEKKKENLT